MPRSRRDRAEIAPRCPRAIHTHTAAPAVRVSPLKTAVHVSQVTLYNCRASHVALENREWELVDARGGVSGHKGLGKYHGESLQMVALSPRAGINFQGHLKLGTPTGNLLGWLHVRLYAPHPIAEMPQKLGDRKDPLASRMRRIPVGIMGISAGGDPVAPIERLGFLNAHENGAFELGDGEGDVLSDV